MIRLINTATLIMLVFAIGCSREDTVRYVNKEKGYSIAFPKAWETEHGFEGSDVIAFVPQEAVVIFRPNIFVGSEQLQPGMDEGSYYRLPFKALTGFNSRIRNFHLIENRIAALDGVKGKGLVYSYDIGDLHIRVISVTVVKNGTGYIITGTTVPEQFQEFREKFLKVADSFRFE